MTVPTVVATLLGELMSLGIRLELDGERLRYHPKSKVSEELRQKMGQHKAEILAVLRNSQANTTTDTPSDDSVSGGFGDRDTADPPLLRCAPAEEVLLSKAPPGVRTIVHGLNTLFADTGGVTVLSVTTARQRVAGLIRQARRASKPGLAVALRDCWRERVAICTVDGAVPESEARSIALAEVEAMQ